MTTLAKGTANQRNAQHSTGPKADAGNAVARLNAVAHGLRAAATVVPGEDAAAWEEYRDAIVSDLAPAGMLETELADRVTLLSWRLRRVASDEAGVAARASDKVVRAVWGEGGEKPFGGRDTIDGRPTLAAARTRVTSSECTVATHAEYARLFAELAAATDDTPFDGEDALRVLDCLADQLPQPEDEDDDFDLDDDPPSDPMTDSRHTRFLLASGVPVEAHDEPGEWCGWTAGAVRAGAERIARSAKWSRDRLL